MEEFDSSTINSRSSSEPVTEFSIFIEKLSPILSEMKDSFEVKGVPAMQKAVESLETDYNRAKSVMDSQNIQSSSPAKHIERLIQNLGRSLGLVLFTSHDVPMANREKIEALCKEMMNLRFDYSSDRESEFADEEEETEDEIEERQEEEIVEEEPRILTVDDAILQIKYGNEEKFKNALSVLNGFVKDGMISHDRVIEEDVVKMLSSRLSSCKGKERAIIVQTLRHLILQNDQHKENMKDLAFLSSVVRSLTRDEEEQREAVGLLLNLSDDAVVRRRMGRVQGCIVMLVAISNGDNPDASHDARMLLNVMSGNAQHALHMAEAGYFKPLVKYLKEGSEMSKVLMATALSRLELTDQNKASLGEDGAIEPLVKMFNTGNLEAKLSALNALQSLSTLKQNIQRLIDSGIVVALLQLLFSVTSVLMTLREPASAILAKVAQSESILVKQDVAHQMLSLLSLSSPVIQNHLLEALNNIVVHASASKVRKKMKENGAIQLLLPFFTERDTQIRTGALRLVYTLTKDLQEELMEQIGYEHVHVVANVVSSLTSSECEKAAALGILSNLPVSDGKVTDILKNANLLPLMVSIISLITENSNSTPITVWLAESIAAILIRFTVPTDKRLQHYSVDNEVIPVLLMLLSRSSETAKRNSALCLTQLSQNSLSLSKSRKLKWFCMPPSVDAFCSVHDGYCSVKNTFCLVKAGAVIPLIRILEGTERGADEAVLSCLSTLLQDEIWENGCNFLARTSAVHAVIRVLTYESLKSREKALWILERVFRVEAHREQYGESAQVLLIDLAQNGDPMLAPSVAKLLAQLELLQDQSSYF
ncbi:U-box domain-containing protein 44 [Sesamum indicum]|uniref:U-box domain-containing protein 44 n=1 Tax=Sesamum indicum TaxID=4182 RepID=A0A6I9TZN0_SESIN|nr:U-box domain-containing protein 44 [Sesamum indicum]XP_011091819.1 U-box domain-containing protein 44 [Sesamum indicum]